MNLIECGAMTLGLIGGGVGMGVGYRWAGLPGMGAGLVLGALGTLFIGGGTIIGVGLGINLLERTSKRLRLSRSFGHYQARRRAPAWAELEKQLVPGSLVRGRVVQVHQRGCFIDIGVGFPARLSAAANGRLLTPPALHTEVEAFVYEFDASEWEVVLTTEERWWLTRDGVTDIYLVGNPPFDAHGQADWAAPTLAAHDAFRQQLERGPFPCQLRPPRASARPVLVEQTGRLIRIRDVAGD